MHRLLSSEALPFAEVAARALLVSQLQASNSELHFGVAARNMSHRMNYDLKVPERCALLFV